MAEHTRKVGERGQVTIPKELRERHGIEAGDEVVFVEREEVISLVSPTDEDRLAKAYRKHAERSRQLAAEMAVASSEANEPLGEHPDSED